MKYTTITFDIGGVLMSMDRERVAREYIALAHASDRDLDFAATLRMYSTLDDEIPARVRMSPPLSLDEKVGEHFWKTLFADGWSRLGLAHDDAAVHRLYTLFCRGDFNRRFDDVRPTLDALKARGMRLGIISNFPSTCAQVLQTLDIAHYFSFLAVSAIIRAEKPDRAIFDHAARLANRPVSELVHVGDGTHADVDGARGAGWNAILLDRDNWYPDYAVVPRIRRLTELIDLA
ncbi:MAG: HAD-IA family hydrolase [Chloroflexi bacterium]|nr:HAD-IA family hydrolase [Chloroflexota bacterium]